MCVCESDCSALQKDNNYHSTSLHLHDQTSCSLHFLTTYFLLKLLESTFHPHFSTEPSPSEVTNDIFLYDVPVPVDSIKLSTPWRLLFLCHLNPLFCWFTSSLLLFLFLFCSPPEFTSLFHTPYSLQVILMGWVRNHRWWTRDIQVMCTLTLQKEVQWDG